MTYSYKEQHLDKTGHNLTYKYGSNFTPTQITYHQTANKASAQNERDYLNSRTDNVYIGFHFVVDDKVAIECLPLTVQTWHAGDGYGDGNMKSIGIEIAYSTSDSITLRNAAIENGAKLIATLMNEYKISIDKVLPHQARSGKHCPHDILDRYGNDKFRALIQAEYHALVHGVDTPVVTPPTSSPTRFKQYDQVVLHSSTNGYMSSMSTTVVKTLPAGTYKVYKSIETGLHRLNVSVTGETPDVWIDLNAVNKNEQLSVLDTVILSRDMAGYTSSTDSKAVTTLYAGTYYVYKIVQTGAHPINISKVFNRPGAWTEATYLSKK